MHTPQGEVDKACWFIDALSSDITVGWLVLPRFKAFRVDADDDLSGTSPT